MVTTIKVSNETKKRLSLLDIARKGKSFDIIINDLATFYEEYDKKYKKEWKKYFQQRNVWDDLLEWAKTKGFKPKN